MTTVDRSLGRALPLADDLFLIGLHERSGAPLVASRAMAVGLAGALLGELLLSDAITVVGGRLFVRDRVRIPDDPLLRRIFGHILAYPQETALREWILLVTDSAIEGVGQRLLDAKLVNRQEPRRLGRSSVVYHPVDGNLVPSRAVGLAQCLNTRRFNSWHPVLLGALLDSVGLLTKVVLWDREKDYLGEEHLRQALRQAEQEAPAIDDLRRHVASVFGSNVVISRR